VANKKSEQLKQNTKS